MKKLFVGSAAALALASGVAMAEESGVFVGLGVGASTLKVEGKENTQANGTITDIVKGTGATYEFVAGYKQFFTDSFGLRYYGHFSHSGSNPKPQGADQAQSLNAMNYGVNIDALYNFVSNDALDFGAFVGLGLGATTWSGKIFDGPKKLVAQADKKLTMTGFDVALNVGLRSVFAKSHGVEIAARVPFVPTTNFSFSEGGESIKITSSSSYNVGVRYTFAF